MIYLLSILSLVERDSCFIYFQGNSCYSFKKIFYIIYANFRKYALYVDQLLTFLTSYSTKVIPSDVLLPHYVDGNVSVT